MKIQSPKAAYPIGIVMIATNKYLDLWKRSVLSIEKNVDFSKIEINLYLMTDQPEEAKKWEKQNLQNINLTVVRIPNLRWPDATLLRYKLIIEHRNILNDEFLMYLDSDMTVLNDFSGSLINDLDPKRMNLVVHPGYVRIGNYLRTWISEPKFFIRDLRFLKIGQFRPGAWEKRKSSLSYVPLRKRKVYYHGAIWLGSNCSFLEMCEVLSRRIDLDYSESIVATWHDESHLNWYAANYEVNTLDSRYSWHADYKQLKNFVPFITTMEKNDQEYKGSN